MKQLLLTLLLLSAIGTSARGRLDSLPPIKYSAQPATVKGKVKGYKPSEGPQTVLFTYQVFAADSRDSVIAPIMADGTFRAELKTLYTDRVDMHWADTVVTFVVTPAEETPLTIDPQLVGVKGAKKPAFDFGGTLGDFNTDLVRYVSEFESIKVLAPIQGEEGMKTLRGLTVMQYRDRVLQLYDEAAKAVDADKRLCGAFKQYVKATYKYQIVIKTMLYNTTLMVANDSKTAYELPDGYYSYLTTFQPFATPAFFYTMHPVQGVAAANMFSNYAGTPLDIESSLEQTRRALKYVTSINDLTLLSPEEETAARTECLELSDVIFDLNNKLKAKIEAAKNSTDYAVKHISADLTGADVFAALIAPYRGQPLLVDFWATWCGPCRAAMETIKPVKEALKGKANFIYITSPTSPQRTWELTIPDIHGDHYYVTDEQYSTLLKQFESNSIPTYVTVDSEGNVTGHYIGYPGNDVMMDALSK